MAESNRQWVLKSRPHGMVDGGNFEWREEPKPEIRDREFLVRNVWVSCDPAQRAWMEIDTYVPKVPIGEVMRSMIKTQIDVVERLENAPAALGRLCAGENLGKQLVRIAAQ